MRIKTLQEQFGFRRNPPGAGLLYFVRYSSERIDAHRKQVVKALNSMDVKFRSRSYGEVEVYGPARDKGLDESYLNRLDALLEELSILNEASDYYDGGAEAYRDIAKLKDVIILNYNNLLAHRRKAEASIYICEDVPRVIKELRIADKNNCLYAKERKALDEIERFCRGQDELLSRRRKVVVEG